MALFVTVPSEVIVKHNTTPCKHDSWIAADTNRRLMELDRRRLEIHVCYLSSNNGCVKRKSRTSKAFKVFLETSLGLENQTANRPHRK